MVRVKQWDNFVVNPNIIIVICVSHFKELLGSNLLINEVIRARRKFYNVVGCIVHDSLMH